MKAHPIIERLRGHDPVSRFGFVRAIGGGSIEADGPGVAPGSICTVEAAPGSTCGVIEAEVIRVDRQGIVLAPFRDAPTFVGARVTLSGSDQMVQVGDAFLGRAVDAFGRPIDGAGPIRAAATSPLHPNLPSPLERTSPHRVLETGLRAIDGCLTLGVGQRVGIFAPSGAGKTTLITRISRHTQADVTVMCLVGERGREVEAIWSELTGKSGSPIALVAATSDEAASLRVRAAHYAMSLAHHWRAQGRHVLLIVDSVTRLAMAMRELGLAAGEPPTIRAYTPGVFAALPRFVERCGALRAGGAITAVMTVLSESEEIDDPICELMKSVLDGHILLSRRLAEKGHFPAIDLPRSVSRQASDLLPAEHDRAARRVRSWISDYEDARTLIETGLYAAGASEEVDIAIRKRSLIDAFLRQEAAEVSALRQTASALEILGAPA